MGRIAKAYRAKFCALLRIVRARKLEHALAWLSDQAQRIQTAEHVSIEAALTRLVERTRCRLEHCQARSRGQPAAKPGVEGAPVPRRFLCDAGLGGLARWLRAAGYEAHWHPHIEDPTLLADARRLGATLLTTDSLLMERRLLRDGIIPALWLPPVAGASEQLEQVLREFHLPLLSPRCMTCGGELRRGDKEALRERIPPRTYRWLDDYFVCQRCDKLFWHGTHWQRIRERLTGAK
jgi:uncharacterized protein